MPFHIVDHGVVQGMGMVGNAHPHARGNFSEGVPGVLSPRGPGETVDLGVKMVNYVLGSSPAVKDLEARMRSLAMVSWRLLQCTFQ